RVQDLLLTKEVSATLHTIFFPLIDPEHVNTWNMVWNTPNSSSNTLPILAKFMDVHCVTVRTRKYVSDNNIYLLRCILHDRMDLANKVLTIRDLDAMEADHSSYPSHPTAGIPVLMKAIVRYNSLEGASFMNKKLCRYPLDMMNVAASKNNLVMFKHVYQECTT